MSACATLTPPDTLPGVRVHVASWSTPDEARDKYTATPAWDARMILETLAADPDKRAACAGRSWHIGAGKWLSACGYCDAYSLTDGPMPSWCNLGPHMVAEHAARVPGINVGIMA
ncbi:MAG: hypothetical protein K0Q52_182 [Microbacterium sp.]|jgi:hypothetical protein|nr:hypothetical protein [Microbacterium sp.]